MKTLYDYDRVNSLTIQTWAACLQTIALRAQMMATHSPLSTTVINETVIMGTEKLSASLEIYSQMQSATEDFYHSRLDPLSAWENMLRPINKKAVSNARRLSRQAGKRPTGWYNS